MPFDSVANNLAKIPVVSHSSGSPSLVLGTAGTQFPSPPFRVTAIAGATYGTSSESLTIFGVSAVATDTPSSGQCTLTVAVAEGTADQAYSSSDYAECRITAGTISDLNSAVATLQAAGYLVAANNLSDVASAATARGNLGLGSAATQSSSAFDAAGAASAVESYILGLGYLTAPVSVAHGGTGQTSLTTNAVLLGGSSAVGFAATGTAGRLLVDQGGSSPPAFQALSGSGATITLSAAGVLAISSIANSALASSSVTVTAGAGLSGGGAVALGSSVTLSLSAPVSVADGGTGDTSLAAYAVLCGGTTSTGALQQVSGLGTSGYVLTSNGPGALPTWQAGGGGGGSPGGTAGNFQANNGSGGLAGATYFNLGSAGQVNLGAISAPGSPNVGDSWYDSTQTCRAYYEGPGGLVAYRLGLIYSQVTDVTVTASGGLSLVSTTSAIGSVSLPAGFLDVAGRGLRLSARGYYSTAASSPGTVTFTLKLGSSAIATTIAGTLQASQTTQGWTADVTITTKATGTSGKLDTGGNVSLRYTSGFPDPYLSVLNGTTAGSPTPGTQVPLDLTQAYTLDFQVNLSVATDSITLTNLTLEVLG